MKLNEISSKKCWIILNLDDGSHVQDVTVDSVYLSKAAAEKAWASLWYDMVSEELDGEDVTKLDAVLNASTFSLKKFDKVAMSIDGAFPSYDNFSESYMWCESVIKG